MIDKASEATDGYELADFLGRDEANGEIINAMTTQVVAEYPRDTTYCSLKASGLPDGWEITRVRFGTKPSGVEVVLSDESEDDEDDGPQMLDGPYDPL